jgi:hypothetical protein
MRLFEWKTLKKDFIKGNKRNSFPTGPEGSFEMKARSESKNYYGSKTLILIKSKIKTNVKNLYVLLFLKQIQNVDKKVSYSPPLRFQKKNVPVRMFITWNKCFILISVHTVVSAKN